MKDDIDWEEAYIAINSALYNGFTKKLVNLSHKQLAGFGNRHSVQGASILEIGAGSGEHFSYVTKNFESYTMTDISTWGKFKIDEIIKSNSRVVFDTQDVQNLGFPDESFDRLICSCVLMHVDQPYQALQEMKRVTKVGGVLSFYIAADPGILLRLIRLITTAPKIKNLSVSYKLLNALSHRNNAGGLVEIAKHVFQGSKIQFKYYPFCIKSWNLSTHIVVNVIRS